MWVGLVPTPPASRKNMMRIPDHPLANLVTPLPNGRKHFSSSHSNLAIGISKKIGMSFLPAHSYSHSHHIIHMGKVERSSLAGCGPFQFHLFSPRLSPRYLAIFLPVAQISLLFCDGCTFTRRSLFFQCLFALPLATSIPQPPGLSSPLILS